MRVLHEDPYSLTEVEGVGFARADAIALAADVPPESDRRAQAAAAFVLGEAEREGHTHLPLGAARQAHRVAARPRPPTPTFSPRRPACWSRRAASTASRPTPASCGSRATLRARAAAVRAPRPRAGRRARATSLTAEQWAAVARRLRRAPLGDHRRPGRRQDGDDAGDRRRGGGGRSADRALRADRPRGAADGGGDRPHRGDDPPPASSGCRAASPATAPATPCPPTWSSSTRPRC